MRSLHLRRVRGALSAWLLAALLLAAPAARAQTPSRLEARVMAGLAAGSGKLAGIAQLHPFAFSKPIFGLPMVQLRIGPEGMPELQRLSGELAQFARRELQAGADPGSSGYDWMFAQVYSHVTREIVQILVQGQLQRPDLMRTEIGQFYEVYARNLRTWRSGGAAERAWARAARVSQKLARLDIAAGRARHDRMSHAGIVLLQSMYAHITVDLPRVLMLLYHAQRPATSEAARELMAQLEHDFYALTPAFDRSVSAVLNDQWVSWEHAEELPPLVRVLVERYGAGTAVRLMRTWAFERFQYNVRRLAHRDALLALPSATGMTHLLDPRAPAGTRWARSAIDQLCRLRCPLPDGRRARPPRRGGPRR